MKKRSTEAWTQVSLSEVQGIWVWLGVTGWFANGLNLLPT